MEVLFRKGFLGFFLGILFVLPVSAFAYLPLVVTQDSLHDVEPISDPTVAQTFYGRLQGFPHTYEIRSKEPFLLRVEVLIPDREVAKETVNSIIIREVGKQGVVTEVTRILAKDALWESFYEPWGGDRYRRGGTFESTVDAGVYRIELSTPDNDTQYVLSIGTEDGDVGYFEMVGRIADVKVFFGKSRLMVIQSPYVYIPLLVIFALGGLWYWYRMRVKAS